MKEIQKPDSYKSIDLLPFCKKSDSIYLEITHYLPIEIQANGEMEKFFSMLRLPKGISRIRQIGEMEFVVDYDREIISKEKVIKYIQTLDI